MKSSFTGVRKFAAYSVLMALTAVFGITSSAGAESMKHHGVISIREARALPLGTVVTVQGTVTVPSGVFFSGTQDNGFAIQEHTAGIFVSMDTNIGLKLGGAARVTGQLADSFGLLVIGPVQPDAVKRIGFGRKIKPLMVATGNINELTEGLLVQIEGTITQPVQPDTQPGAGFRVFVNDGTGEIQVFVNTTTGIDVSNLAQGDVVTVIGFSSHFQDATTNHFEIDPRKPGDIVKRASRLTP